MRFGEVHEQFKARGLSVREGRLKPGPHIRAAGGWAGGEPITLIFVNPLTGGKKAWKREGKSGAPPGEVMHVAQCNTDRKQGREKLSEVGAGVRALLQ